MSTEETNREAARIRAEVEQRLGFFPPLLEPAADDAALLEHLWREMARSYVESPLPELFKEKLVAHLGRYCAAPHHLVVHSCALHEHGLTGAEVRELLERPIGPDGPDPEFFARVGSRTGTIEGWPEPGSEGEDELLTLAITAFVEPPVVHRAKSELRRLLRPREYSYLSLLLSHIWSSHLWAEAHPEITPDLDVRVRRSLPALLASEPRLEELFRTYRGRVLDEERDRAGALAASLESSEERYRALVETAGDAIVSGDSVGRIISFNAAAESLFGLRAVEAIGQPLTILMPERFREPHRVGLRRYLQTGEARVLGRTLELAGVHADGTEFPLEMTLTSWHSGADAFFTGVMRDARERRRLESRQHADHEVTRALVGDRPLAESGPEILRAMAEALEWQSGELWLIDRVRDELACEAVWHEGSPELEEFARRARSWRFGRGQSLAGRAWESGEATWIPDVLADDDFLRAEQAAEAGLRGAVAVPLRGAADVNGVLVFFASELRAPDGEVAEMMSSISATIGASIGRRDAEQALRASRAQLAEAQRVGGIGSWEWDIVGDRLHWSDELCRIFGVEPTACPRSYEEYLDLIEPEDREAVDAVIKGAYAERGSYVLEHRLRRDGETRVIEGRGEIFLDEGERPVRMSGTARDVTEAKAAERALTDSEARFRALTSAAPVGIYETDPEGNTTYVNERWCEIAGITRDEAEGQGWTEAVHPDDLAPLSEHWDEAIRANREFCLEYRYLRADGEATWVAGRAVAMRDGAGEVSGYLGTVVDITQSKQIEQRLAQLALKDDLTGLANRRRFREELERHVERGVRYGWRGAALILDLDHLKAINDTMGHAAGDQMIRQAGARLSQRLRSSDFVARLGGDEFAVLLPEADRDGARATAQGLVEALAPYGVSVRGAKAATASIGVAMICEAVTAEELMIRADVAMYEAKGAGGNRFAFYDPEIDQRFNGAERDAAATEPPLPAAG